MTKAHYSILVDQNFNKLNVAEIFLRS